MKQLTRDEMKTVFGGNAPAGGGLCEDGETMWICGHTENYAENCCTIDVCDCQGNPLGCDLPVPCW